MEQNKVEITVNGNTTTYKVTNPSNRLLAMMRLLRMKKNKRRKEAIEKYFKENIL